MHNYIGIFKEIIDLKRNVGRELSGNLINPNYFFIRNTLFSLYKLVFFHSRNFLFLRLAFI